MRALSQVNGPEFQGQVIVLVQGIYFLAARGADHHMTRRQLLPPGLDKATQMMPACLQVSGELLQLLVIKSLYRFSHTCHMIIPQSSVYTPQARLEP